jgi:DNA polymerase-1
MSRGCPTEAIRAAIEQRINEQMPNTPAESGFIDLPPPIVTQSKPLTGREYLIAKGLDPQKIVGMGFTINDSSHRIEFPLHRNGTETGQHFIHLDRVSPSGSAAKSSHGTLQGSCIVFQGSSDFFICEGPTTGLSIHQATGGTVLVACGVDNFLGVPIPNSGVTKITVVADSDQVGMDAAINLCEVLQRRQDIPVFLSTVADESDSAAVSETIQSIKGFDFNDSHQRFGSAWVADRLTKAKLWSEVRRNYWPPPTHVSPPEAKRIPVENLPAVVADFIAERAHSMQVHPDRLFGCLLAVLGSLAAGRFALSMRSAHDDFLVCSNNFVFQVGRPSAKKSPAMKLILSLLKSAAESENKLRLEGEAKTQASLKSIKCREETLKSSLKNGKDPAAQMSFERDLVQLELERRTVEETPVPFDPLITNDATPEAIVALAAGASRGILLSYDEADKLIKQMAREGFAEIRPLLNTGFSGRESYRCDRVTVRRPPVETLRLGLLAGVQPDVLTQLTTGTDDGFLSRCMFINPEEKPSKFVDETHSALLWNGVQDLINAIYERKDPMELSFNPDALKRYESLFAANEERKLDACSQSKYLEGFLGKFEAHFGALCIVLHVLDQPIAKTLPLRTVEVAQEIFDVLITHCEKTLYESSPVRPLVEAIQSGRFKKIQTVHELKRTNLVPKSNTELESLLKELEEDNVLRVIEVRGPCRPTKVIVTSPHLETTARGSTTCFSQADDRLVDLTRPQRTADGDPFDPFGAFDAGVVIPSDNQVNEERTDGSIQVREWTPVDGLIGSCVAIDTETSPIVGNEIPELRLLQACADPDLVFMVSPTNASAFLGQHHDAKLVFHNFSFDCAVILKATGIDLTKDLADVTCRIVDTGLLYRLICLAVEGEVPNKWNLALMAQELLGIDLPKDNDVRLSWDSLADRQDDIMDALTPEQLEYAALDASVTLRCYEVLKGKLDNLRCPNDLSHHTQLQGAWALRQIEARGIAVDQTLLQRRLAAAVSEETAEAQALETLGYVPNQKGNRSVLEAEIRKVCEQNGIDLKMTEKSDKPRIDDAALEVLAPKSSLIDRYLKFTRTRKLADFLKKLDCERIYPRYNNLLRTGRTSCSSPNIQNLPRNGIREVLVPAPGHCFIIADYAAIELVTLAQHCLSRYGHSKMAELINEGRDLHTELARHILKTDAVTTEDRRKAKALNFGIPGGLGAEKLCEYAASTFGVEMSLAEAKKFKSAYLKLFPEVAEHLKSGDGQDEVVSTLSGRIAAKSTYCQARNFVFQGLASDGAKRALFNLERAGLRTVAFIHDEVIVEVPYQGSEDTSLGSSGRQIETIMIDSMRHFTPDVVVKVEWYASDRWSKDGELTRDSEGNVIPFVVEVANG